LAIQANVVKIDAMYLTPHGRLVMPDDITNAAQFLFSPNAKMICSQVLTVDGGYTFLVSKLSF
jgi:NAD(P)-dependent dehydrogenase (short-subunit alcohol dehydrogenase family)